MQKVEDVIIACRGLVLRDDQLVWYVKEYIWPRAHPVGSTRDARPQVVVIIAMSPFCFEACN